MPVTGLTPVPGGFLHQTFRAESPDGPLFLKLYTGPDWPLESIAETLEVQDRLYRAGHPVPRVWMPPIPVPGGVWAIMAFLPGSRIETPGPDAACAAGAALGRLHRTLRPLPLTHSPVIHATEEIKERALRLQTAVRARSTQDAMDELAMSAAQWRLDWLARSPIDPEVYAQATAQWVHGDYYPGNLLYTPPDQLNGIVDFDFVSVRFRGLELARATVEFALRAGQRFDPETAAAFLRAYLGENEWPRAERVSSFRIWLEYLLGSLYPLPLRYQNAPLPHGWEWLARRRHELLLWLGAHLADLEHLAAKI